MYADHTDNKVKIEKIYSSIMYQNQNESEDLSIVEQSHKIGELSELVQVSEAKRDWKWSRMMSSKKGKNKELLPQISAFSEIDPLEAAICTLYTS